MLSRAARWRLWAHYVLRRHPLTGRRVKGLRWQLDVSGSRPIWKLRGQPEPNGVRASWEWPG